MKVNVQENSFLFMLDNPIYEKMKLVGKESQEFELEESIEISANLLDQITQKETSFVDIFLLSNGEWLSIDVVNFSMEFIGRTEIKGAKSLYSCYIGGDGKLRINNEGFISNKTILKDIFFESASINKSNDLCLLVSLKTKYFSPKKINVFLRNRKTNSEIKITSEIIIKNEVEKISNTQAISHTTVFKIIIDKNILISFIDTLYSSKQIFFNWLDIYYNFEVEQFTSSNYAFRLPSKGKGTLNEVVIEDNNNQAYFLKIFATDGGYLSFNYYIYLADEYRYFRSKIEDNLNSSFNKEEKKTILVGEYPHTARDNGLAIFNYLMKHHSSQFNIFYCITRDSEDLERLTKYHRNILFIGTQEYTDYYMKADVIIHSHFSYYLCPFASEKGLELINKKTCYFIQHGVVLQKDVSSIYSYDGGHYFDYVITSSEREAKVFEDLFGFPKNNILDFGLPRFDSLFSLKQRIKKVISMGNNKKIFAFFTWRNELNNLSFSEFKKTDYYKSTMRLLNDPFWSEHSHLTLTIKLHSNLEKYTELFTTDKQNVFIKTETDPRIIQDHLIESDIMITDYSSAGLDFSIMEKPVIYYPSFDTSNNVMESYYDYLPGDIVDSYGDLLKLLSEYSQKKRYETNFESKLDDIYTYRDNKASKRLIEHISENV